MSIYLFHSQLKLIISAAQVPYSKWSHSDQVIWERLLGAKYVIHYINCK